MHMELPNIRLVSLKDFAKHYLMIVLSILTALGLEAWIEHTRHVSAAAAASIRIESEIRSNLDAVQSSLAKDEQQAKRLAIIRDRVQQEFKAHTPEAVIAQHIQSLVSAGDFNLNLDWPTIRHEAWDVAVADQSASWIERGRMQKYSAAYASLRDVTAGLGINLTLVMNGPRMIDTLTDIRAGEVQPREFLRVINQMTLTLDQAQQNLQVAQKHLQGALPGRGDEMAAGQH